MSDIDQEDLELEDQEGVTNFTQLLEQSIRAHTKDLRVFMPGKIVTVSGDRVSVQLCVQGANAATPEAILRDVRLCYPGSKAARLAFRVVPGDDVLVLFSDRSLDEWNLIGGGSVQASDPRTHDMGDAVAVPVSLTAGISLGVLETLSTLIGLFITNAATIATNAGPGPCILSGVVLTALNKMKTQINAVMV